MTTPDIRSAWDDVMPTTASRILQRASTDPVCDHAWVIAGSAEMDISRIACAFGQALMCEEHTACGQCRSCTTFLSGTNLDSMVVAPDGESISVDTVRILNAFVSLRPVHAQRRVVIVQAAERMTAVASNALLKTLEEPPDDAIMILATTSTRLLPSTILSRARLVQFGRIPFADARSYLLEHGMKEDAVEIAYGASFGLPTRLRAIIEQGVPVYLEQYHDVIDFLSKTPFDRLSYADRLLSEAIDPTARRSVLVQFVERLTTVLHELLRIQIRSSSTTSCFGDSLSSLVSRIPRQTVVRTLKNCYQVRRLVEWNTNPLLLIDYLVINATV